MGSFFIYRLSSIIRIIPLPAGAAESHKATNLKYIDNILNLFYIFFNTVSAHHLYIIYSGCHKCIPIQILSIALKKNLQMNDLNIGIRLRDEEKKTHPIFLRSIGENTSAILSKVVRLPSCTCPACLVSVKLYDPTFFDSASKTNIDRRKGSDRRQYPALKKMKNHM